MGNNLWKLTAANITVGIASKSFSASEVVQSHLQHIERVNPKVNAIVTLDAEFAVLQANEVDKRVKEGKKLRPLEGVPIGIKDTTAVKGMRTTHGSKFFEHHVPDTDDIIVDRIKASGAIILGKTNTPEFAAGGNTFNDIFGATKNPWNLSLSAGGSTGGGAAGLAAGMFPLASGSDLGGSLRIPAAFCGVQGIRPTVGLVPVGPKNLPFQSLGVSGPMARNSHDLGVLLEVMAKPHYMDPLSPGFGFELTQEKNHKELKLAYVNDPVCIGIDNDVADKCEKVVHDLANLGHKVEIIEIDFSEGREAFEILRAQSMVNGFLDYVEKLDQMGENIAGNIKRGLDQSSLDVARAEVTRGELWKKLAAVFTTYDALVTPTLPITPFPFEDNYPKNIDNKPTRSYIDWFSTTFVFSLFGVPALSVPAGLSNNKLPVGLQIIGPHFSENRLLRLAKNVEELFPIGFPTID